MSKFLKELQSKSYSCGDDYEYEQPTMRKTERKRSMAEERKARQPTFWLLLESTTGCSKYSIDKSIKPTITVIFFWVLLVPFCQSRVQNSFLDPYSFGCLWAHGFWPSHLKIIWYLIKIRSIPRLNKWRNDIYN